MNYLLDTHVWVWAQSDIDRIGPQTLSILEKPDNELHVSTISTLEIARLQAAGRIELSIDLNRWIRQSLRLMQCETIPLNHAVAVKAYALPDPFHKDPADRIIAATALEYDLALLTADRRLLDYPHLHTVNACI